MSNVVKAEPKPIDTVRAAFEKMKPQFANALPKHITPERMVRVALTAIQNTPKLLECNKQSLYSAVMRAAQLGLEPDGILGQAYLIPYGDTVQFIPGYKGLIDLARRSGEVSNIIAKEVCEKDNFKITWHEEVPFVHDQAASGDRGKVIGFWAMARFKDGGFHFDYMPLEEILAIRDNSTGYKAAVSWANNARNKKTPGQIISPWEQNFNEMGKKTAIRRIAKYLPMSVQKAAVVEDLIDAGKKFTADEYGEIIIDGSAEEVEANDGGDKGTISKLDSFAGAHDTETGEITGSPDQEANTPSPELPKLPDFDINQYRLETQTGTKEAVKALVKVLEAYPAEERPTVFIMSGGMDIVSRLGRHGIGSEKKKFTDLGIVIPEQD